MAFPGDPGPSRQACCRSMVGVPCRLYMYSIRSLTISCRDNFQQDRNPVVCCMDQRDLSWRFSRVRGSVGTDEQSRTPASGSAQSAFTRRICSMVAQFVCRSRGDAKTRLSPFPLLTATLSRSRDNRKSSPRDVSSEDEAVIETSTIGASCPWNLSTVPTRIPGRASDNALTCAL